MNDEQINAAIATECEWKVDKRGLGWLSPNGCYAEIPNYTHDLNAMHEAEKTLVREVEWIKYSGQLAEVTDVEWSDDMDYICAPARQRAEAFLRTIGKWEEAE